MFHGGLGCPGSWLLPQWRLTVCLQECWGSELIVGLYQRDLLDATCIIGTDLAIEEFIFSPLGSSKETSCLSDVQLIGTR